MESYAEPRFLSGTRRTVRQILLCWLVCSIVLVILLSWPKIDLGLVPGAVIYGLPVGLGAWFLYRLLRFAFRDPSSS